MTNKSKKPVKPVEKPFLTGSPADERTVRSALAFFGVMILTVFVSFLVCTMMNMGSDLLRIGLNLAVVILVMFIFYNNAVSRGAEAVARGEILWQRQGEGLPVSASAAAVGFHPLKGYLTGFLGTPPFLIAAAVLAVVTKKQTTGYGALPGWMSAFQQRSEIGDALVAYTAREGLQFTDILRLLVRIVIMPFISMTGSENRDGLLLAERLSPLLTLLPALAFGTGYLQGRRERTRIHTGIAENRRSRARKEKRERKARTQRPKTPEQLN